MPWGIDVIKCSPLVVFYLLIRLQGQSLVREVSFEIATFNVPGIWILGNHFVAGAGEERKDDGDWLLLKDLWKHEHQHGVILHGIDLKNLRDQRFNCQVCVDLVSPLYLTYEVEINWADEVLANLTNLFEYLLLLLIFVQDLFNKSIIITLNLLQWLEQSQLDLVVVIKVDITHALSEEHLLRLEEHLAPEGIKAGHQLSFETERYHWILEINNLLEDKLSFTSI